MSAPAEIRVAPCSVSALLDVRHAVLRAGRPSHTAHFDGDNDPRAIHLAATLAGHVVGCVTLLPRPFPDAEDDPPDWQLRGMAVVDAQQGRGLGSALLHGVHDALPDTPLWCNARAHAVGFYRRHGWRVTSDAFQVAGIGPHHRMIWRPDHA